MTTNDTEPKPRRTLSRIALAKLEETGSEFRDEETGSIIVFSLFLLIILLFTIGMAVDVMRYETRRVAMQSTLDNAIVAASSLTQDLDAETVVLDHIAKAGFNPDLVDVKDLDIFVGGPNGNLVSRSVSAESIVGIDTFFMNMLGIEQLEGWSNAGAYEAVQDVEISLVVDISGSMGSNKRLANLKVAAEEFFQTVLQQDPNSSSVTTISVIPYNATVVVGNDILDRLNSIPQSKAVTGKTTIAGSLTSYMDDHTKATCVRFDDQDFLKPNVTTAERLTRVAHFDEGSNNYNRPADWQRWCNPQRSEILVHSANLTELTDHIKGLKSGGWTGIDNGVKWGVALLDPAFRSVINGMADDSIIDAIAYDRPGPYQSDFTKKYLVVMTDGANTIQRDLKDEFKNGPTRVWYADSKTTGSDGPGGRDRTEFDGYYVLMPKNGTDTRWFVPGDPNTTDDDQYVALTDLPLDARQLDYIEVYDRFAVNDVANFFFGNADPTARDAHLNAVTTHDSYGQIDARLADICQQAKLNNQIEIFAIGFEAPYAGQQAMKNCATGDNNYFDVSGTDISKAFASIAAQITSLRLTQ